MDEQSTLHWISVGGNTCEPARLCEGKIYTIGCPDGTVYNEECGVELIKEITKKDIPDTPAEADKKRKQWQKAYSESKKHGYRTFK